MHTDNHLYGREGILPYYVFPCRPVAGVVTRFQVPLREGYRIVEQAESMQNGQGKCFRFVLSHVTGKIEILGPAQGWLVPIADFRIMTRFCDTLLFNRIPTYRGEVDCEIGTDRARHTHRSGVKSVVYFCNRICARRAVERRGIGRACAKANRSSSRSQ